jgi:hypothetical protein|tara:strand:- start:1777 stop:1965 length:189 start_codon:yes stop_codon:yes gene_type:complete
VSKEKQVTIKMDVRSAAVVRQLLFEAQRGYTYDQTSVPPRIIDIRSVILDIDEKIGAIVGQE